MRGREKKTRQLSENGIVNTDRAYLGLMWNDH